MNKLIEKPKKVEGALKGTSTRAYHLIADGMSLYSSVMEISHNAFEHGNAGTVKFFFNKDEKGNPFIRIFNNGNPMSDDIFLKFIENYHCHDVSNSVSWDGNYISIYGYGLKDALVYMCSDKGKSFITITNYHKDGHKTSWKWCVDKNNGDNGYHMNDVVSDTYDVEQHSPGFEIKIENSKVFTDDNIGNTIKKVRRSFSNEILKSGKTIQIFSSTDKDNKPLVDPLHISEMNLGDKNIYNCDCGVYCNNEIVWYVKDAIFSGIYDGKVKSVKVRTINAYFNGKQYDKIHESDKIHNSLAGIYPLLGPAYIEQGDNYSHHFGSNSSNFGGGAPRIRLGILITEENKFLWGLKGTKTDGLSPFYSNELLTIFKVIDKNNECINNMSAYNYLKSSYMDAFEFHKKSRSGRSNEKFEDNNTIINDFKNVIENKYSKSPKNSIESSCVVSTPTIVVSPKIAYAITDKESVISKVLNDDYEWEYSLKTENIGKAFNLMSKESLIYAFLGCMEEVGVSPDHYQKTAKSLSKILSKNE